MVNKDFSEDVNLLKYYICKMCLLAQSGHPSSSLSCSDIIGTLYFSIMDDHDKFILSKGHAAPALYSALMIKKIIPKEYIDKLREIDSPLQGHPDISRLPEVNITSGALGQGLSFSIGLALSKKIKNEEGYIYCVIGDGEVQEGQVWEATMFAGNRDLNNLVVFLDNNGGQSDGKVNEIMPLVPITDKWESFGWQVSTINGHDHNEIINVISSYKNGKNNKPLLIVSETKKGHISENLTILDGMHGGSMTDEILIEVKEELAIGNGV